MASHATTGSVLAKAPRASRREAAGLGCVAGMVRRVRTEYRLQ